MSPIDSPRRRVGALSISRVAVRDALNAAEKDFRWCWTVVKQMKRGRLNDDFGQRLIQFQPRLVDALLGLEDFYRAIKREERRLVRNKAQYDLGRFSSRMQVLRTYARGIQHGLAIGRAVGDGFAWFFYERDLELVEKHLAQQRQVLLPPDVGGFGERVIVNGMQGFGGALLIYHGTTTFLRLGDISLVDLKSVRVACIGEVKTIQLSDREYQSTVHLVAGKPTFLKAILANARKKSGEEPAKLDQQFDQRLKRQVRTIGEALTPAREDALASVDQPSEFYFGELEQAVRHCGVGRFNYVAAGPALIVAATQESSRGGLGDRLLGEPGDTQRLIQGVERQAMQILDASFARNDICLGTIGGDHEDLPLSRHSIPFVWWPLPDIVVEKILFAAVMVFTLYNPGHLWSSLQQRGFELTWSKRGLARAKRVETDGRTTELGAFDWFHPLVHGSLMSLESVLEMLDRWLQVANDAPRRGSLEVQLRTRLSRGPQETSIRSARRVPTAG